MVMNTDVRFKKKKGRKEKKKTDERKQKDTGTVENKTELAN